MNPQSNGAETVDQDEVARFSRLAGEWWDPHGPMATLHKFNPVRLAYIRDRTAEHFGRDPKSLDSLSGLRFLDIGCGAGILCEPLARLGASVVGADPSAKNIAVAQAHAAQSGLTIDYRDTTVEQLAEAGERFDVVLAMEVVEHVTDVGLFIAHAGAMVKPGGLLFVATLNRTAKSFAFAIVGAEYILRWLPRGTHRWDKFVTPDELEIAIEQGGLHITGESGVDLQSYGRPLAALARHGRQLHGGGGEAGLTQLVTPWLWAVFTVIAAFMQTLRNAMQRELTGKLGTVGATHVRFLFGFPFVIVFLLGVMLATGASLPRPGLSFWPWAILGAFAQVAATALMLAAMGERSFVVTIAYIKTEPIQVAVFGLLFLGDTVTVPMMTAIIVATSGVVIMSTKPGGMIGGIRPTLIGLASGGMFALSAIGFRGAILDLALPNYVMAATFTLAVGIAMQAVVLSVYLALRSPTVLFAIFRAWKPSLSAGLAGAVASQFWFLAFALATAASVRTLALIEVLFAQLVSRIAFGQRTSAREALGMLLVVAGVALLLWAY